LAISRLFPALYRFKHDLFGKPVIHFPDHASRRAQPKSRPEPLACEADHRIKDAGYRRKQERGLKADGKGVQPIDIP
jgi:hypothetical protein